MVRLRHQAEALVNPPAPEGAVQVGPMPTSLDGCRVFSDVVGQRGSGFPVLRETRDERSRPQKDTSLKGQPELTYRTTPWHRRA